MYAAAVQFHPALSGQDTPRVGAIYPTGNNQHAIEALYLWVRQNYPDANAAFWQVRSWDLLCWQPIYLTLFFARNLPDGIDLKGLWFSTPPQAWGFGLTQPVEAKQAQQTYVAAPAYGYDSEPTWPETELVNWLQESTHCLYSQASRIFGIRASLALRLAADNLATALLRQCQQQQSVCKLSPEPSVNLQAWLAALDWPGRVSLVTAPEGSLVTAPEGSLALRRQSCCLEYCLGSSSKCNSCPLLAPRR